MRVAWNTYCLSHLRFSPDAFTRLSWDASRDVAWEFFFRFFSATQQVPMRISWENYHESSHRVNASRKKLSRVSIMRRPWEIIVSWVSHSFISIIGCLRENDFDLQISFSEIEIKNVEGLKSLTEESSGWGIQKSIAFQGVEDDEGPGCLLKSAHGAPPQGAELACCDGQNNWV